MAEDRTVADRIIDNIARRLQSFFAELQSLDEVFARTAAAPQLPPPAALGSAPAGLTAPVH
jgi:hypothetical protein